METRNSLKPKTPRFLLSALIGLVICFSFILFGCDDSSVSPGQVWIYDACKDNPFEESCADRNEVLEVRRGYVKYRGQNGIVKSCSVRWFKIGSVLVDG